MAVLGLRFCARAFSSCGKRGPLFIVVRGPLTIAASLVAEHRLQTRRLSSCGSRAQLLHSMWDLPRPGLEPVSPALAGRLSTTAPPGKPLNWFNIFSSFLLLHFFLSKFLYCLIFFVLKITSFYFFFFNLFIIYLLFIFGCVGSSFLCEGFLQLRQAGATLHHGVRASRHRGLSCCGAQAPDAQAQ